MTFPIKILLAYNSEKTTERVICNDGDVVCLINDSLSLVKKNIPDFSNLDSQFEIKPAEFSVNKKTNLTAIAADISLPLSNKVSTNSTSVGSALTSVADDLAFGWNYFIKGLINNFVETGIALNQAVIGTDNKNTDIIISDKDNNTSEKIVPSIQPPNKETPKIAKNQIIPPATQITKTETRVIQGSQGPQGLTGPVGPQGPKGESGNSIDVSNFVSEVFFSRQVSRIFDSISESIKGLSESLADEVDTKSLIVSGDANINGDLTITGNITGNVVGTINPAFTFGSIPFQGASGLTEDNTNIFWDSLNSRLGVGTSTPTEKLNVVGNISATGSIVGSNLSGANTGDETNSSIKTKLGVATNLIDGYLSSTDWATFNNKQPAGNYLTSSNLSGLIPYTGGNTNVDLGQHNLTVDTNTLFVDSANHRVGVGTTTPTTKLQITGGGVSSDYFATVTGGYINTDYINSASVNGLYIRANSSATTPIIFTTGGNTERMRIDSNGNVGIGTTIPVSSTRLTIKSDSSSATEPVFVIQNSGGTDVSTITDSGYFTTLNGITVGTMTPDTNWSFAPVTYRANTSGSLGSVKAGGHFAPTSGTATFTAFDYSNYSINQTGGANGITRGLYINPILTSAVDFRAIETNVASGTGRYGYYGAGTAVSYFGGNVGIGTISPASAVNSTYKTLQIQSDSTTYGGAIRLSSNDGDSAEISNFNTNLYFQNDGTIYFQDFLANKRMTILSTGNVGIGTSNPQAKLDILANNIALGAGYSTPGNLVIHTSNNVGADIGGSISLGGKWASSLPDNIASFARLSGRKEGSAEGAAGGYLAFEISQSVNPYIAERMRITSTGNVGIGTTAPLASLHILNTAASGINPKLRISQDALAGLEIYEVNGNGAVYFDNIYDSGTNATYFRSRTSGTPVNVMTLKNDGNVGIGTTTPTQKLEVAGGAIFDTNTLFVDAANHRVNIGTENPLESFTGFGKLNVTGDVHIYSASDTYKSYGFFLQPAPYNGNSTLSAWGTTIFAGKNTGTGLLTSQIKFEAGTGIMRFSTGLAAAVERMTILEGGNVGIGTTNPTVRLDVMENIAGVMGINVSNTDMTVNARSKFSMLVGGIESARFLASPTWGEFRADGYLNLVSTNNDITFYPAGVQSVVFKSGGNVGIGTNSPNYKLDVNGAIYTNNSLRTPVIYANSSSDVTIGLPATGAYLTRNQADANPAFYIQQLNASSTGDIFQLKNNTATVLTVKQGGNVGIGTTNPVTLLQVGDSSNINNALINLNSQSNTDAGLIMNEGAGNVITGTGYGFKLFYNGADQNRFVIQSMEGAGYVDRLAINRTSGNVGIGTTNPGNKLEVSSSDTGNVGILVNATNASGYATLQLNRPSTTRGSQILYSTAGTADWYSGTLYNGGSANSAYSISSDSTLANSKLVITTGGNVGIGTTNPGAKLQITPTALGGNVVEAIRLENTGSGAGTGTAIDFYTNAQRARIFSDIDGISGGSLAFSTRTAGGVLIENMRIDKAGNVGIGVVNPEVKLDVDGDIKIGTSSGTIIEGNANWQSGSFSIKPFDNYAADVFGWTYHGSGAREGDIVTTGYGYAPAPNRVIAFRDGNAGVDRMVINILTGNVGIGIMNPGEKLDVSGNNFLLGSDNGGLTSRTDATTKVGRFVLPHYTNSEESIAAFIGVASGGVNNMHFGGGSNINNTAMGLHFWTATNSTTLTGTERMTIDSTGNVGIGQTSPTAALHIKAGTATSGTAPLKFTSGTLLTTTEAGALEFNNDAYYGTITTGAGTAGARKQFAFTSDLTIGYIPYTGATTNVDLGINNLAVDTSTLFVDATNHKVGIGTVIPENILEVNQEASGFAPYLVGIRNSAGVDLSGIQGVGLAFYGDSFSLNPSGAIKVLTNNGPDAGEGSIVFETYNGVTSSAEERMRIEYNGNVGIGTPSPSYQLQVGNNTVSGIVARFENSTGTCDIDPTTASLVCSSDISLKKNITTLENYEFILNENIDTSFTTLEKILALTPVLYNWNSEGDSTNKHVGFIAQEVEQVFPDLVFTDPNTNLKSISYTNLIPYTVKAIQEMDLIVKDLSSLDTSKDNSLGSLIAQFLAEQATFAKEFTANIFHVNGDVCVDDVCITKEEFKQMLINAKGTANTDVTSPEIEVTPNVVPPPVATPPVETENPPVVTPPVETENPPVVENEIVTNPLPPIDTEPVITSPIETITEPINDTTTVVSLPESPVSDDSPTMPSEN